MTDQVEEGRAAMDRWAAAKANIERLNIPPGMNLEYRRGVPWAAMELPASYRWKLVGKLFAERDRQDEKWGDQDWPDGTGRHGEFEHMAAKMFKQRNDQLQKDREITWRDILKEEMVEAFAEIDDDALEAELIQVAAVVFNWLESKERKRQTQALSEMDMPF